MSSEYTVVYERYLETDVKVSKKASEEARLRKLERWPREAGLSIILDESGNNFMQIVKNTVAEYGLELGERKWNTRREDNVIVTELEWYLNRQGQKVGLAYAKFEISLTPKEETENDLTYQAKIYYKIELSNSILAEKASAGLEGISLSGF